MYIIIILQGIVCMYVCIQLMYLYRLLAHFVQLVNFRPLLTGSVSMYYVFIGCNEVDPLRSIAFLSKPSCYISFVVGSRVL